nr:hypothetical protein [Tanacetum cinerariifolium]
MKCFNYQGEGHMARQCPNPKRRRDATWFKDKVLLVEVQGKAYQADDLDAYDFDCNNLYRTKAVLIANLSSYGSDALSKDTNSFAQQDAMIFSVFEQLSHQVTNCNKEKNAQFVDFEKEINYLKQTFSKQSKEKKLLTKTFNVFKNEYKEKEAKNIDTEIALEKKVNEVDNIVYKIDFGKRFVPQRELSDEQALHPNTDQSASRLSKLRLLENFLRHSLLYDHAKACVYFATKPALLFSISIIMAELPPHYVAENPDKEPVNNMDEFTLHMNPQQEWNMNGWIEVDVPLLGEIDEPLEDHISLFIYTLNVHRSTQIHVKKIK